MIVVQYYIDPSEAVLINVGDRVVTAFTGRITMHTVSGRIPNQECQSGVLLEVTPKLDDEILMFDCGWFQKI